MSFNLHLELAGLCLLVQRKSTELLILLPHTPTTGDHKHHAVLGSESDYQPDWVLTDGRHGKLEASYVYHDLGRRPITFETETAASLKTNVESLGVVDLSPCNAPVDAAAAYLQIHLPHGEPNPEGNIRKGACWTRPWINGDQGTRMATMITWTVPQLTNMDDNGRPVLRLTVSNPDNDQYEVVLRPKDNNLYMFLYHTVEDELPYRTLLSPEVLQTGNPAPHFGHYMPLLSNHPCISAPVYLGPPGADGKCAAPAPPSQLARDGVERASLRPSDGFGRRYSCVLATTEE